MPPTRAARDLERQDTVKGGSHIGWAGLGIAFLLTYVVGFGGTGAGELVPLLFVINGVVAAPLVFIWLRDAPAAADRTDRAVLAAVLLFVLVCALSQFPRQSLDAALAVIVFAAAFFVARGQMAHDRTRRWMTTVLIGLSAILTIATAGRWLVVVLQWMEVADWRVLPPLNLELPSEPWGHRHDLTLLVAMLYPSWWINRHSRTQRVLAVGFGVLVAFVVVLDGSRTLWAAIGVATIAAFGQQGLRAWRRSRAIRIATASALILLVILVVVSGLGGALFQRMENLSSVGFRTAMWGPLIDAWAAHPIAGSGPGSFPWILQGTGYFDTNSFAPRHPDSAPLQLLAEGGLLGLASLGILLAVVIPALLRGRSRAAAWALLTFGLASIASNPTDFVFMVAPAIVWAAVAIPRPTRAGVSAQSPRRMLRYAIFGAASVLAVAYLITSTAALPYLTARNEIIAGAFTAANDPLDLAVTLDPGMALYVRDRGAVGLSQGGTDAAVRDLKRAAALNPNDHVAWRGLAIALKSAGDSAAAREALDRAIQLRRSDPSSLLLLASWDAADGQASMVLVTLAEVVHAWPEVIGAPGWAELLDASSLSSTEVLSAAADRWEDDQPIPETVADQGVWLAVLADRPQIMEEALEQSGYPEPLEDAALAALRCQPATAILNAVPSESRRVPLYWGLVLRDSALTGPADEGAKWMLRITTGETLEDPGVKASPLNESSSTARWGYRRAPAIWPVESLGLPSPAAGLARWLLEPEEAVTSADLGSVLPGCVGR